MTTRRAFLASLLAAASVPRLTWADAGSPAYLAAAKEPSGDYALFGLAASGQDVFRIPLPGRGHAAAAHPTAPEAVAFARRPGTFALVIDCTTGVTQKTLHAPEGRHFYGHGAFVDGGNLLCTPENDYATGEGRIGIWDRRRNYERVGEIASGGTGPHDILRLDGDVLVIANGGIRTHPDQGRDKLNLDTMRPNLAYATIDGGVEEVVELDTGLHKNSIRHLAARDGLVAFAMQWQGDLPDAAPLLGLHRRGSAPILCTAAMGEQMAMQGYAGSVAISPEGLIGITSPRGSRLHVFRPDGSFAAGFERSDICGLAEGIEGFVATDGMGTVIEARGDSLRPASRAVRAWDNHLVKITVA
ncbi:DUF1513 domain-containing protein [Pseudooceanicola sp. LIPI14-2-Ac024]|uniref:DUF1513 domain-containing protein n=1 Tax=Pseudooceanicola sp. LIPI14-2-Ac024 TaxID=3344875 RepID=UPI0035CE9320